MTKCEKRNANQGSDEGGGSAAVPVCFCELPSIQGSSEECSEGFPYWRKPIAGGFGRVSITEHREGF